MLKIIPALAVVLVVLAVLAVLKLKAAGGAKRGTYYLRWTPLVGQLGR